jgi:hypothetical protein
MKSCRRRVIPISKRFGRVLGVPWQHNVQRKLNMLRAAILRGSAMVEAQQECIIALLERTGTEYYKEIKVVK